MKIGANTNTQGSFSIPPAMKAAAEEFAKKRDAGEKRPSLEGEEAELPEEFRDPAAVEDTDYVPESSSQKITDPLKELEDEFDIKLEDEDFHKIVFKGYLEKDVIAVPSIRGSKPLVVTFRSLNGEEYDLVDELLAEDVRDLRMTNEGFSLRRGMWILTAGITRIQGKPLCNSEYHEVGGKKELDVKATTRKKRDVIAKLNAAVLTRLMRIHSQLTVAINYIIEDPQADYLKKP